MPSTNKFTVKDRSATWKSLLPWYYYERGESRDHSGRTNVCCIDATYTHLFEQLKSRGVETVWLCTSIAHSGLKCHFRNVSENQAGNAFKVHCMQNILVHILHKEKESIAFNSKQIWNQPNQECTKCIWQNNHTAFGKLKNQQFVS